MLDGITLEVTLTSLPDYAGKLSIQCSLEPIVIIACHESIDL